MHNFSLNLYLCIFRDWVLHNWTPFVRHFPELHSGVAIELELDGMIKALNLHTLDIPLIAVNDNASNCKKAIRISNYLQQFLCAIHTLQLGIEDTFKKFRVGGTKMMEVIKKAKELSTAVKQSHPRIQELKKACEKVGIRYTTLKNQNETRWNSKYTNLSSCCKVKKALVKLSSEDEEGFWASKVFVALEWKLVEAAVLILEQPLLVTKAWEAEKTPTLNLVVSELYNLKMNLTAYMEDVKNDRWGRNLLRLQ